MFWNGRDRNLDFVFPIDSDSSRTQCLLGRFPSARSGFASVEMNKRNLSLNFFSYRLTDFSQWDIPSRAVPQCPLRFAGVSHCGFFRIIYLLAFPCYRDDHPHPPTHQQNFPPFSLKMSMCVNVLVISMSTVSAPKLFVCLQPHSFALYLILVRVPNAHWQQISEPSLFCSHESCNYDSVITFFKLHHEWSLCFCFSCLDNFPENLCFFDCKVFFLRSHTIKLETVSKNSTL